MAVWVQLTVAAAAVLGVPVSLHSTTPSPGAVGAPNRRAAGLRVNAAWPVITPRACCGGQGGAAVVNAGAAAPRIHFPNFFRAITAARLEPPKGVPRATQRQPPPAFSPPPRARYSRTTRPPMLWAAK